MALKSIPLSVSSKLTSTDLSTSSISANPVENKTGKTGAAAPILLTVKSAQSIDAATFASLMPLSAGHGTEAQARLVINAIAEALGEIVQTYGAITVNTPFGTVETYVSGTVDSATTAVDPLVNIPFLGVKLDAALRAKFAAITAVVATGESPATLKRIRDKATSVAAICGVKPFYIEGTGLTYGGTGEKCELLNPITRAKVCDVTVTDHVSRINWTANLPGTSSIPAGPYLLRVTTLGGVTGSTTLWPLELKVTLAESVVVPPELTKIKEGTRPDNTVGFTESKVTITGTNIGGFKTGDQLRLEGVPSGAAYLANMSLNSFVTASDETSITLGQGFENLSEKPDTDWDNKQAVVTLVRDGASYPLTFNFVNA